MLASPCISEMMTMRPIYTPDLLADVSRSVEHSVQKRGTVNVPLLAQRIKSRNRLDGIAMEEVESLVLSAAQLFSTLIEFDGRSPPDIADVEQDHAR